MEGGTRKTEKLSKVVKECTTKWFHETIWDARGPTGDIRKQVLVSQMYFNGYGVPRDPMLGEYWMKKASKSIPSIHALTDKRPGYGASDSDSDESSTES